MGQGTVDYYNSDVQLAASLTKLDTVADKLDTTVARLDSTIGKLDSVLSSIGVNIGSLSSDIKGILNELRAKGYGTATAVHVSGAGNVTSTPKCIISTWADRTGFTVRADVVATGYHLFVGFSPSCSQASLARYEIFKDNIYNGPVYVKTDATSADYSYEEW